jgi:two-component system nitrate/nitrite response regulator NarL
VAVYQVLIADDSERARAAIRMILQTEPEFHIVSEATTGHEAIEQARAYRPDLVLMDIDMPDVDGLMATRTIKRQLPHTKIVILSVSDDVTNLFEALRNGAQGYLVKRLQPSDWVTYLHQILDTEASVSQGMAGRLFAEFKSPDPARPEATSVQQLTVREQEVLALVSKGVTNKEIASRLFISENTVKNHLKNMMAKLHIANRVQLATYAKSLETD